MVVSKRCLSLGFLKSGTLHEAHRYFDDEVLLANDLGGFGASISRTPTSREMVV